MEIHGGKILTMDGKEVCAFESATFELSEPEPEPTKYVNMPTSFSGTLRYENVKKTAAIVLIGVKAKTKRATVARLQRMGMTKAQAKAYMH